MLITLKALQSPQTTFLCCQSTCEVFLIFLSEVQFGPFEGVEKKSDVFMLLFFPFFKFEQ